MPRSIATTREEYVYLAKLAERYEEMVEFMEKVTASAEAEELTVQERNLLSVAYNNVIGARRASWRMISSIEQREESRGSEATIRAYRSKIETEATWVCDGIIGLLDTRLIPSAGSSDSKDFYLKMKADYHRYLAEFQTTPQTTLSAQILNDRVNDLPDDIVSFTLSFLSVREATRSSILARKWRNLWKCSVKFSSSLCLDVLGMRGSSYPQGMFRCVDYCEGEDGVLRTETCKFLKWADQILQLDYSPVINSFRIQFYFNKDYAHLIDQWMEFAIAREVQNYDVDLGSFGDIYIGPADEDCYTFPFWLFTSEAVSRLKCLCLTFCIFKPLDLHCFTSLVDLQLENVLVDRLDFTNFLSNCPNLENLCLSNCLKLFTLIISGPSLKLKYLTLDRCTNLESLVIDAGNLTRFEYGQTLVEISFLNVSQLSDITYRVLQIGDTAAPLSYALGKLSCDAPKLESLFLTVMPIEESMIPAELPLFANLKKLVLMVPWDNATLWDFILLVHASPYLQKLELHLNDSALKSEGFIKPFNLHFHLKEIMFTGYGGTSHEIDFTKYLVKSCTILEKIIIDYEFKFYDPKHGFHTNVFELTPEEVDELDLVGAQKKKETEEQVVAELRSVLDPSVELLVL